MLGRVLSRDPIGHAAGLNLYEYASSSPSSRVDPAGLDSFDWGGFFRGSVENTGRFLEALGAVEMAAGISATSAGGGMMLSAAPALATGPGGLIAETPGATTATLGLLLTTKGAATAYLGQQLVMMSQKNGDCSQIDPMGGLTEKQAYEAISNPKIPNRLPKRYHLNNNVMPGKGKFLTQSRDEARQILREGLANLDEIGFWPNPQMEKTFRAVTKHASEIGTRGQKKIRAIIDYVNKEVKNFFPTKNQ